MMQSLAIQLKDPNNCGTDYTDNNPVVLQAYHGFISYQPMFQAGCEKDGSGSYCEYTFVGNDGQTLIRGKRLRQRDYQ